MEIAKKMKFSCDKATQQAAKNIEALYQTFIKCDCTMVEVGCHVPSMPIFMHVSFGVCY
jgi:succinyl-CoA synthetase beta subunit